MAKKLTAYNNPLYQGQDPFLMRHTDGYYYFVATVNIPHMNGIYVAKSKSMIEQGEKKIVYDFKDTQHRIFAPEIFFINGKWYIYYCSDYESMGWQHMAGCLESVTDDPQGEYIHHGPFYTGENGVNYQANDFTVLPYKDKLYAIWGTMDHDEQPAIAPMDNPYTITADRIKLPPHRGEGPRVVTDGEHIVVTVSMGPFACPDYHLGAYTFDGKGDILSPDSWSYEDNVFNDTPEVWGPARSSFVKSADGTEDYMVYHSKVYSAYDNGYRQVNIQKFTWENGKPVFGKPVSPFTMMPLPSGDPGFGDVYFAEDAKLDGIAIENTCKGCQGDGYAVLDNKDGSAMTFTVQADETADHYLRIRYAYGVKIEGEYGPFPNKWPEPAKLSISVNGAKAETVLLNKTNIDWERWMYGGCRIALNEGENKIVFSIEDADTPELHIDYIAVDTL